MKNEKRDSRTRLIFLTAISGIFFLLLKESVYSSEYIDKLGRFSEISMPEKEGFYSNLNMEDVVDVDYMQAKRVYKDFEIN